MTKTSNKTSANTCNSYLTGYRIGILGGGQLAQMLILKGYELGLDMYCLSNSKEDPAALVTKNHFLGSPENKNDLESFFKKVQVVTFESEFYSAQILSEVAQKTKTKIYPQPHLMEILRDRLSQKNTLVKYNLKTSPFSFYQTWPSFSEISRAYPLGCVFKKRWGGYDGNGTFIVRNKLDYERLISKHINAEEFICESFINFKSEKAILLARNQSRQIIHFPLVTTAQKDQRCDWVMGPSKHPYEKALVTKIKKMLNKENYIGLIAFELFDTGKELLINEIAPRVHNTGHYTQNIYPVDQFAAHLLSLMNVKITLPKNIKQSFVMTNLIGETNHPIQIPTDLTGHIHWYNKKENRPGRKMGHINYIGNNQKQLLQKALKERKRIRL